VSGYTPIDGAGAIAFSDDGLALLFPDTGKTTALHPLKTLGLIGVDRAFAWSPDATRIAFLYTDARPAPCGYGYLMLADLQSGEVRPLVQTLERYSRPAWSPDGIWLAYTDQSGDLGIVRVGDGEFMVLSEDALGAVAPAWVDGEHIAYVRGGVSSEVTDLVSQPLDGSSPSILLADTPGIREFVFSPDRQQLAYYGRTLNLVDLHAKVAKNLGGDPSERLQWSPDGQYLLGRGGLSGVYLVRPNVALVTQLDFFGIPGTAQSWASDSRRFAVILAADNSKHTAIGIYALDSHTLKELPIEVQPPYELAWSTR
jgi:Tol biopolymer transport system component